MTCPGTLLLAALLPALDDLLPATESLPSKNAAESPAVFAQVLDEAIPATEMEPVLAAGDSVQAENRNPKRVERTSEDEPSLPMAVILVSPVPRIPPDPVALPEAVQEPQRAATMPQPMEAQPMADLPKPRTLPAPEPPVTAEASTPPEPLPEPAETARMETQSEPRVAVESKPATQVLPQPEPRPAPVVDTIPETGIPAESRPATQAQKRPEPQPTPELDALLETDIPVESMSATQVRKQPELQPAPEVDAVPKMDIPRTEAPAEIVEKPLANARAPVSSPVSAPEPEATRAVYGAPLAFAARVVERPSEQARTTRATSAAQAQASTPEVELPLAPKLVAIPKASAEREQDTGERPPEQPSTPREVPRARRTPEPQTFQTMPIAASDQPAPQAPATRKAVDATAVQRSEEPRSSDIPTPPRELRVRLADTSPESSVEVRVRDRAGELLVAVRTPSPKLAQSLRNGLPQLVGRLSEQGFQTQVWNPPAVVLHGAAGTRETPYTAAGPQGGAESQGGSAQGQGGQQNPPNGWSEQWDGEDAPSDRKHRRNSR